MIIPQYLSREDVERRLGLANQQSVPMLIKTKTYPVEYRQVCNVRLTKDGFVGTIPNASPWDRDVVGTELVFINEQIRFDLSGDNVTPTDSVSQCKKYVESLPTAISGQGGTVRTRYVADVIFHDFALNEVDGWITLLEYNTRCQPCWSVPELRRHMSHAIKSPPTDRPRGVLRNKFVIETFGNEKSEAILQ